MKINIDKTLSGSHYFTSSKQQEVFDLFQKTVSDPKIGFYQISNESDFVAETKKLHQKFKHIKQFVHVGIGGSSLGPEMIINALAPRADIDFIFINNIDPDKIASQLQNVDPEHTLYYFVSKSGATAETLASFTVICSQLSKFGIQSENYKNHMVFATDPEVSQLREIANELEIETLPIPSNIGGRFSVLTPVGLFPALFAGINIDELLEGAHKAKLQINDPQLKNNSLIQVASQVMALKEKGVTQTVMMPYSSLLRDYSFWFVQLWAESLGKKYNKDNEEVLTGLTPIPSYGATDQHSQMQLFMEGPYDKLLFIIEIDNFTNDFPLDNQFAQPALQQLSGHSMAKLFKAELLGTLKALQEEKRPFIQLKIENLSASSLGELILFAESLTVCVGECLGIDPFNQPGVELGKKYAYQYLQEI